VIRRTIFTVYLAGVVLALMSMARWKQWDNGLGVLFGVLFLATLFGQAIAGHADFNHQQIATGAPAVSSVSSSPQQSLRPTPRRTGSRNTCSSSCTSSPLSG
jgi:hypothetical protein